MFVSMTDMLPKKISWSRENSPKEIQEKRNTSYYNIILSLYVSATKHLNTTTILSEHVEKALWEIFKIPENTNIHLWT